MRNFSQFKGGGAWPKWPNGKYAYGPKPIQTQIAYTEQGLWRIEYLNTGRASSPWSSPKMWALSLLPVVANWH